MALDGTDTKIWYQELPLSHTAHAVHRVRYLKPRLGVCVYQGQSLPRVKRGLALCQDVFQVDKTENVDSINWNDQIYPGVRFSRMLTGICRHDNDFQWDDHSFVSLDEILAKRRATLTLGKLLALVYTNPKARFQLSYPVYRVSGVGQKRFVIPDTGIRALHGRSRDGVGPEVLTSAQEQLFYHPNRLPEYCAHGTSDHAWTELLTRTGYLMRGGPMRVRQAVHFAVSLPSDTGNLFLDSELAHASTYVRSSCVVASKKTSLSFPKTMSSAPTRTHPSHTSSTT